MPRRRGGALAVEGHQVGAIDARGAGVPERVQRPHERLTVGHGERGAEHGRTHGRVLVGRHHEVHGRSRQVAAAVAGDQRVHPVHHLDVVGDRERNAEDLRGSGGGGVGVVECGGGGDCVKIPGPVAIDPDFWTGRRVLLTGHTGFKGAWTALWLQALGAHVSGLAPGPPTQPSLYELARVARNGAGARDRRA